MVYSGRLVLSVVLFVAAVERGWIGYMPDLERIQNPINKFASQALTADGKCWVHGRPVKIVYL